MNSPAVTAAANAAEELRQLNHATIFVSETWLTVDGVYSITADLSSAAHRLRQACEQLGQILDHRLHAPSTLVADDGSDPALAIGNANRALRHAASHAASAGTCLSDAANAIAMIADPALDLRERGRSRGDSSSTPTPSRQAIHVR
jgi:hypothetical protein